MIGSPSWAGARCMSSGNLCLNGKICLNEIQRIFPTSYPSFRDERTSSLPNWLALSLPHKISILIGCSIYQYWIPSLWLAWSSFNGWTTLPWASEEFPFRSRSVAIVVVVEPFAVPYSSMVCSVQRYVVCNQWLIHIFFFGSHQSRKIIKCAMNWKGFFAPLFNKCTTLWKVFSRSIFQHFSCLTIRLPSGLLCLTLFL